MCCLKVSQLEHQLRSFSNTKKTTQKKFKRVLMLKPSEIWHLSNIIMQLIHLLFKKANILHPQKIPDTIVLHLVVTADNQC